MPLANSFDLLADIDNDNPSLLLAAQRKKPEKSSAAAIPPYRSKKTHLPPSKSSVDPPAKLPFKHLLPSQAAKGRVLSDRNGDLDTENRVVENGLHRSFTASKNEEIEIKKPVDGGRKYGGGTRRGYHGRRGGYSNEEAEIGGRPLRRQFDRHSAMGRGNAIKREGSGPWNWGILIDQGQTTKPLGFNCSCTYTMIERRANGAGIEKEENTYNETEEQESEYEEMTFSEYEKILEEKKKALQAMQNTEERRVDVDEDFASMLQLSAKKISDEIFIKLGSEKETAKKKNMNDKEEMAKKLM